MKSGLVRDWFPLAGRSAITAAPATSTPTARSARTASPRVAPVVTMSSTNTTTPGGTRRRTPNDPATFSARADADNPAWSRTRRTSVNADVTRTSSPSSRSSRADSRATSTTTSAPRARRRSGRLGIGTRMSGPSTSRASTDAASRCASGRSTVNRPRSFQPITAARSTPSYSPAAATRHGRSRTTRGVGRSRWRQSAHSPRAGFSHATHRVPTVTSARSASHPMPRSLRRRARRRECSVGCCGQPQANFGFDVGRKSPSSAPANGRRGNVRTNSVPSPGRL